MADITAVPIQAQTYIAVTNTVPLQIQTTIELSAGFSVLIENPVLQTTTSIIANINPRIYVVDSGNNLIQVFDYLGNYLFSFGSDILNNPYGIDNNNDLLYVTDTGNNRIAIFDLQGNYIKSNTNSNFTSLKGIAVDNYFIYVVDYNTNTLLIFTNDDNFYLLASTTETLNGPTDIWVDDFVIKIYNSLDNTYSIFNVFDLLKTTINNGLFTLNSTFDNLIGLSTVGSFNNLILAVINSDIKSPAFIYPLQNSIFNLYSQFALDFYGINTSIFSLASSLKSLPIYSGFINDGVLDISSQIINLGLQPNTLDLISELSLLNTNIVAIPSFINQLNSEIDFTLRSISLLEKTWFINSQIPLKLLTTFNQVFGYQFNFNNGLFNLFNQLNTLTTFPAKVYGTIDFNLKLYLDKLKEIIYKIISLNLYNQSVTEYKDFNFNSIVKFNGNYLTANESGIYLLTDNYSNPVSIEFTIGGIDQQKGGYFLPVEAHLNGKNLDALNVKITDENENTVVNILNSNSPRYMDTVRIKLPKGLRKEFITYSFYKDIDKPLKIDELVMFMYKVKTRNR